MFAPLDSLDFPVDATFSCRWVPNRVAGSLVRKRKVDADMQYREENLSAHGPSIDTTERALDARELEQRVGASGGRPPLLRGTLTLSVGVDGDPERLRDRVERLRAAYGQIALHQPAGDQVRAFTGTFPAQGPALMEYAAHLEVEQFGAMVPHAATFGGSDAGPYVGYTLTGSRQPVLFDPTEASRQSRPATCLVAGTLGSGKTVFGELVAWQAFMRGSRIVDVDPKGDHHLDELPGIADRCEATRLCQRAVQEIGIGTRIIVLESFFIPVGVERRLELSSQRRCGDARNSYVPFEAINHRRP